MKPLTMVCKMKERIWNREQGDHLQSQELPHRVLHRHPQDLLTALL